MSGQGSAAKRGKWVFITGAADGIGRATALLFAGRGWRVAAADVNASGLASLAEGLGPDSCLPLVMDVTQPAQVEEGFQRFAARSAGRLDLLINNAGILYMGRLANLSLPEQHRTVEVNLKGVLTCLHQALPLLRATPGAAVVNLSSASAIYGVPELAVYAATKAALKSLTESLSLEWEPWGIRVSDLMPPFVNTAMVSGSATQAASVRKMGVDLSPEMVAQVIWRAAHGNKLHWLVTPKLKALNLIFWGLPFVRRVVMKALAL